MLPKVCPGTRPSILKRYTYLLQGDNGLREYEKRTTGGGKKKAGQKTELSYHPDNFRIYFPSHETVNRSRGGKNVSYIHFN